MIERFGFDGITRYLYTVGMGRQIRHFLFFLAWPLVGEDSVRINLVARSKITHQTIRIEAKDLRVSFDGAPQPISTFEPLGCKEDSAATVAVILDSTQVLQGTSSPGGAGFTDSGARRTEALTVLNRLSHDAGVEAYAWAPRLVPIRMLQEDGSMDALAVNDVLKVFDRHTIVTTGRVVAQNHGGVLARWSDMERLANHLAARPGRKALIWYCMAASDSPDGLREGAYGYDLWSSALLAMNRENVAVYPIDCLMSAPQEKPNYRKLLKSEPMIPGSKKLDRSSYSEQVIANYTGGRFYASMTKLEDAIRDGLADSKCSYELTWSALGRAGNRRAQRFDPRIHSVQITTSRPDVELLYPDVYFEAPLPQSELDRLNDAESGLIYRVPLSAIPVRGSWNGDKPQARYRTNTLSFRPDANGIPHAELDVVWAFYDVEGNRLKAGKHFVVRLTPKDGDVRAFQDKEQVLEEESDSPSGATELRVLLRDVNSGRMGTTYLAIPGTQAP